MKKTLLFSSLIMAFFCTSVCAQNINTDSLNMVNKLSDDQLKLTKLQAQVEDKIKAKNEAAEKAQKSADDNALEAAKLSNSPNDKKLARKADNAASDARDNASAARKAARRLHDLNKDIADLKDKIADEQSKLKKLLAQGVINTAPINQLPAKADTAQ